MSVDELDHVDEDDIRPGKDGQMMRTALYKGAEA